MNPELLEAIGKALYEASFALNDDIPAWDELSENTWIRKSTWTKRARKVVETYKTWIDENTKGSRII